MEYIALKQFNLRTGWENHQLARKWASLDTGNYAHQRLTSTQQSQSEWCSFGCYLELWLTL
jgi:hypothetical protein